MVSLQWIGLGRQSRLVMPEMVDQSSLVRLQKKSSQHFRRRNPQFVAKC